MVQPFPTVGLGQALLGVGAVVAGATVVWLSLQRRFDWLFFVALILLVSSLVVLLQLS